MILIIKKYSPVGKDQVFDSRIKPSQWYYGLAALIMVVGIAFAVNSFFISLSGLAGGLTQVIVPGESDIYLFRPGEYTIFYENQTVVQGRVYSNSEDISGLLVEVKNKTTGSLVSTYTPSGSQIYSIAGRSGRSVLAFYIDQPGNYVLTASYPEGRKGPEVVLAIGHGFSENMISDLMYFFVLLFGSLILGTAIIIITYIRRRDAHSRALQEERLIRGG